MSARGIETAILAQGGGEREKALIVFFDALAFPGRLPDTTWAPRATIAFSISEALRVDSPPPTSSVPGLAGEKLSRSFLD
jgi:hypothetical protein